MTADAPQRHPFDQQSALPYGLPPFAEVTPASFAPAFDAGMAAERAEVAAIVSNPDPPTFDNTVVALERSGRRLRRAQRVFWLLANADSTDELAALETAYAREFAAHTDAIMLDRGLFERLTAVYERRADLVLGAEQLRLLERYHTDFVRAGAALDVDAQRRLAELNLELAECSTKFGTNLLADTNDSAVHFADVADLDGLSDDALAAAAEALGSAAWRAISSPLSSCPPINRPWSPCANQSPGGACSKQRRPVGRATTRTTTAIW